MPLHDWTDRTGWEGLRLFWMTEIARSLRADLPPGYRAIIGSSPLVAIGVEPVKPDVAVTNGQAKPSTGGSSSGRIPEPDQEVAVATLEEDTSVPIEKEGRLIAAVELVSPRNKDRPASREQYGARYLNYLRGGVHLALVDVHRRPLGFSFPQLIAQSLGESLAAPPAPSIVSYRVGAPAAQGGRFLAVWQFQLSVGQTLPSVPLALAAETTVMLHLEQTYQKAAADSYLG